MFLIRYEAARRIEEEHDAKLEEKEQQKKEQRKNAHNKSGEWKESESGIEWIAGDKDTSMSTDLALPGTDLALPGAGSDHESEGEEATDFTEGTCLCESWLDENCYMNMLIVVVIK